MYGAPEGITDHIHVICPSGSLRSFKIAPGDFVEPGDEQFLTKQRT